MENRDAILNSVKDFATEIFQISRNEYARDFIICPLLMHYVLYKLKSGASGTTAGEISNKLGTNNWNFEEKIYYNFLKDMTSMQNFKVRSKLFVDNRIKVKQKFKDDLKSHFNSTIIKTNFRNKEKITIVLNNWLDKESNSAIQNALKKTEISEEAMMLMTSLASFSELWDVDYHFVPTEPKPFHMTSTYTYNAAMMMLKNAELFVYNLNEFNAKAIGIPYRDENFIFIIIMPNVLHALSELEDNYREINFGNFFLDKNNRVKSTLILPRFSLVTKIWTASLLEHMGLEILFNENADWSNISNHRNLQLDDVYNCSFIEINEVGTGEIREEQDPVAIGQKFSDVLTIKVNQPFLIEILNLETNIPIFIGRVYMPIRRA